MSLVHKEWYLCRFAYKATYITAYMHCVQCGQTSSPVVGLRYKQIQCNFEAHLLRGSNLWVQFGVTGLSYILDYRIDM